MAKQVSPGVLALRKVVDDVYADAREAKKQGKLVGWSSSKFPCELAEAFDLNVMYPVSAPAASSTPKRSSSSSTPTAASPSRTKTARSSSILRPASPRKTPRRRSPTRFWTISTRSRLCPRPPRRRSPTRTSAARPSSPSSRCASPSRTSSCAATTSATA